MHAHRCPTGANIHPLQVRLFLAAACAGLVLTALPAAAQEAPRRGRGRGLNPLKMVRPKAPRIELSERAWDFGEKWSGQKAETTVTLRNTGEGPLRIKEIRRDCSCMVARLDRKVLPPGESEVLHLSYNTRKPKEYPDQKVRIFSNDPKTPVAVVHVRGHIRKVFNINIAHSIEFGVLGREQQAVDSFEIECLYEHPVKLKLAPAQFEHVAVKLETLEPGRRYRFVARTKPPLPYGVLRTTAKIETGLPFLPELPIRITGFVQPPVAVEPAVIEVPSVIHRRSVRTIRLTSRRPKPIQIVKISASLPEIHTELLRPDESAQVAAGAGLEVFRIRVSLPSAEKLPAKGATITIATDDKEFSEIVVPVRRKEVHLRRPRGKSGEGGKP